MQERPKSEYRIFVEDITGRTIGTFASIDYRIKSICFDGDKPVFKETFGGDEFVRTLGAPNEKTIKIYTELARRQIQREIQDLQNKLAALDKEPILESQIYQKEEYTTPEKAAILKMEKEFYKVNEFKPPNDYDEGSLKINEWLIPRNDPISQTEV